MKLLSDVMHIVANISWGADIAGMIVSLVLWMVWYSQMVFGKMWMQEIGFTPEKFGTKSQNALLLHIPIAFLIAANISAFCKHFEYHTAAQGGLIGYDLGLVAILLMAINYIYEQKSLCLYGINAGFTIVSMSLMGVIIGIFV